MLEEVSNEETVALAAYEPIESEFRTQAYKKWRNEKASTNLNGPRLRHRGPDVKTPTLNPKTYTGVEGMNMVFDYYPLDEVKNPTPALSFVPGKQPRQVAGSSVFKRASIRLWKSFRIRCSYRNNLNKQHNIHQHAN